MVTNYLKYLGFNEQTIQTLPEDIMNAAIIYDGLQKIYMDIPATDTWKKESFAKAIALGTRNLLIRINYLVNNPQGVTQNVQQQITQLPEEVKPNLPKHKPQEQENNFGLKIGDKLPEKVITAWSKSVGNNFLTENDEKWKKNTARFISDREITGFRYFDEVVERGGVEEIDEVLGFEVSGTASVFLRAEGFKEFMDSFEDNEPSPKEPPTPKPDKPSKPTKPSKPAKAEKPTKRTKTSDDDKQNELTNKLKNIEF